MPRTVLRTDGWGTAVFGVLMLTGGAWLAKPLGLPSSWFAPIGVVMVAGGAALGSLAERPVIRAWVTAFAVLEHRGSRRERTKAAPAIRNGLREN
ncbi:hypothetical protein [Amycolatopsis viridis]|uniref:Uncharacterized protein n=1 Tax=Amycolatopsis viridis TaxID=185678 RepID=A0ABX0T0F8_9PSEU|nr:hypothetical protein [Amycolatopsis viridis]NIH82729.1 hypothetical protein [Amycolatopsis viridis]